MVDRDMARDVYRHLSDTRPLTATGAAHIMHDDYAPAPTVGEITDCLTWLRERGLARINPAPNSGFGTEYLRGTGGRS